MDINQKSEKIPKWVLVCPQIHLHPAGITPNVNVCVLVCRKSECGLKIPHLDHCFQANQRDRSQRQTRRTYISGSKVSRSKAAIPIGGAFGIASVVVFVRGNQDCGSDTARSHRRHSSSIQTFIISTSFPPFSLPVATPSTARPRQPDKLATK